MKREVREFRVYLAECTDGQVKNASLRRVAANVLISPLKRGGSAASRLFTGLKARHTPISYWADVWITRGSALPDGTYRRSPPASSLRETRHDPRAPPPIAARPYRSSSRAQ